MLVRILKETVNDYTDVTCNTLTQFGISRELDKQQCTLENSLVLSNGVNVQRYIDETVSVDGKQVSLFSRSSNVYYWIDGNSYHKNLLNDMAILFTGNKDLGKYYVSTIIDSIPHTDYKMVWTIERKDDEHFFVQQKCTFADNEKTVVNGVDLVVSNAYFPTVDVLIDKEDYTQHTIESNNIYICLDGENLGYIDLYGLGIEYSDEEIELITDKYPMTKSVRYDKLSHKLLSLIKMLIGR